MTRARRWFLSCVFLVLIGGSVYDVVRNQEHWPFSQYPMFSGTWKNPTFTWLRLFGVTGDGREIALASNEYIQPFDQSRLPKALRRILDEPDHVEQLHIAIADCLARYESLRARGEHDGPPIVAMRLYELEWRIDPWAIDEDHPLAKRFLGEVRR